MAQEVRHKFSPRTDLVEGRTDSYKFFFDLCVPAIECSQPSPNTAPMSKLSEQTISPGYSVLFLPFRNHRKMIAVMANLKHPLRMSEGSSDCLLKGEGPPWVWMARPNGLGCGPRKGKEPVNDSMPVCLLTDLPGCEQAAWTSHCRAAHSHPSGHETFLPWKVYQLRLSQNRSPFFYLLLWGI